MIWKNVKDYAPPRAVTLLFAWFDDDIGEWVVELSLAQDSSKLATVWAELPMMPDGTTK